MMGPKVLGVFRQLVLGEALGQVVERVRGDHQKQDAADEFKETV